ncbi:hypothetical protein H0264_14650 [Nocardia huaxiensis]|uniref:GIY-YIG domain-containing protein n=1 Tax=Nocardia huaxiensis TaxID=2755382 RepID=A0A7D6Z5A2_9NOCA|nr:hypothetical protein [Nocardia huaxiensis]QLY33306.1 hypothetical protein H0264_14650 [Nocardia huaxiensis]
MTHASGAVADNWADSQNFLPSVDFVDVRTVALPSGQPVLSGWYLLRFQDGTFYLGESVNLRGRMAGHRAKWGEEIASVRICPRVASKQELKRRERILTHELEALGVRLRNVVNASVTTGRNALDELLPVAEQERWLGDPRAYNAADVTPLKAMAAQEIRYSTPARKYHEKPDAVGVTALLWTFLDSSVPVPRATEFQYWSVSTGTYGGKRRFCVSVGAMEVFVVNDDLTGFLNVRRSALVPTLEAEREFGRRHPRVRLRHRAYDDAGSDVISIQCPTRDSLQRIVDDPAVTAAAARLILDVMRKHCCSYTRNHCPQVVQSVYPEYPRQTLPHTETPVDAAVVESRSSTPLFPDTVDSGDHPSADDLPVVSEADDLGDVVCYWLVTPGSKKSGRNQLRDFLARGEWRMDPHLRFEAKVADMLPGERIAVRTRRNTGDEDVPFDRRGNLVSVMDFHLTGTITANPGDGCSVKVDWDRPPRRPWSYFLYTNQDVVWTLARGLHPISDDVIGFVFDGKPQQNIDVLRNHPFWADRFGDR